MVSLCYLCNREFVVNVKLPRCNTCKEHVCYQCSKGGACRPCSKIVRTPSLVMSRLQKMFEGTGSKNMEEEISTCETATEEEGKNMEEVGKCETATEEGENMEEERIGVEKGTKKGISSKEKRKANKSLKFGASSSVFCVYCEKVFNNNDITKHIKYDHQFSAESVVMKTFGHLTESSNEKMLQIKTECVTCYKCGAKSSNIYSHCKAMHPDIKKKSLEYKEICKKSNISMKTKVSLADSIRIACPITSCTSIAKNLKGFKQHLKCCHTQKKNIDEEQEKLISRNWEDYALIESVVKHGISQLESPCTIIKRFKDTSVVRG